jgi:hypothetical protein
MYTVGKVHGNADNPRKVLTGAGFSETTSLQKKFCA